MNEEKKTQQPQFLGKVEKVWIFYFLFLGGVLWRMLVRLIADCVFDVFLTWLQRGRIRKHHLFVYVSFHFRRDFWTASTSQRGCPTSFQTEKRSLFLALKHWGFGRCLTRWSRICNIPIRPNGEKFSPRSSWCIFDWDEVQTCLYWRCWNTKWKQNMEGNTCSMPFRAPDVVGSLMYQALAKAFDIKKAQHQRNQMLKHPGTCWWKKSQTTTFYLWNPNEKVRYSPYQLVIAGFLPTDILLRWSSKRRNCKRIRQSLKRRTSCVMDVIRSFRPFGICWSGSPGNDGHKWLDQEGVLLGCKS